MPMRISDKSEALSDNTNLQVISVNGSVLVIGQAPNSYLRDQAIKAINELTVLINCIIKFASATRHLLPQKLMTYG